MKKSFLPLFMTALFLGGLVYPAWAQESEEADGSEEAIEEMLEEASEEGDEIPKPRGTPQELALEDAIRDMLPMTPEQIEDFRVLLEENHNATVRRVVPDPTPSSRSIDLTLKPGEQPPVIRMAGGNVATLTFSDLTGQPWPVLSVTTGNPGAFNAQTAGNEGESNIIVVSPLVEVETSNMVITLVDHPVPIILTLRSGEQEIDYRVDMRIGKRGPNASYDIVNAQSLPPTGDSVMLAFLDGVPPEGAKELETSRKDVEAYLYDDMLYVRTDLDLLSPAYLAKSSNVSDLNVYTLMAAPVLLVSREGRMMAVSIDH